MKIDIQKAFEALANDPEFIREIRYYNGSLKMNMGEETYVITFANGKPVDAVDSIDPYARVTTEITGTDDMWQHLLAKHPVPYYQCIQTTCVKHGMKFSDDTKSLAYLPAWNRMIFVLRDLLNIQ